MENPFYALESLASGLCPECHQPVRREQDGERIRFRCTGCPHSYSVLIEDTSPNEAPLMPLTHFHFCAGCYQELMDFNRAGNGLWSCDEDCQPPNPNDPQQMKARLCPTHELTQPEDAA